MPLLGNGCGGRPSAALVDKGLGDWPHGWQHCASRIRNLHFRESTLLPSIPIRPSPVTGWPPGRIPCEPACTPPPQAMLLALRRHLRLPLPLRCNRCGPPGCGGEVDALGDHAFGVHPHRLVGAPGEDPGTGVGSRGQGSSWSGRAGGPPVSPLSRTGLPQPCAAAHDGAALRVAERRKRAAYLELLAGGPQQLVVLGTEVGGRWNAGARQLLRDLVRVRAQRAPPAVRTAASSAWARRWWASLSVSVQQAVTSTALGSPWPAPPHASPSRLPLRGH